MTGMEVLDAAVFIALLCMGPGFLIGLLALCFFRWLKLRWMPSIVWRGAFIGGLAAFGSLIVCFSFEDKNPGHHELAILGIVALVSLLAGSISVLREAKRCLRR